MSIERDDPERRPVSAEDQAAEPLHGLQYGDEGLVAWAIGVAGASLLQDGLSPQEIRSILRDAYRDYASFRKSVGNPRLFLLRRILAKAKLSLQRRGTGRECDPEDRAPYLLDVIRTKEALDTLPDNARTALHMLFVEKKSFEEIAAELDVAVAYAERLIRGAVDHLRRWRPEPTRE